MAENITQRIKRHIDEQCRHRGLEVQASCDGVATSKIVLIGEAPGEREVTLGRPFVGGSGKYLWSALQQVGINRAMCYCTNVVKRKLVKNKSTGRHDINAQELAHWKQILRDEIDMLPNAEIIVVLGNYALEAIMHESGITNWRGSVLSWNGKTVLCTYNPAAVMRNPTWETVFALDIHKLARVRKGEHNPPKITTHINPSFREACDWLEKMVDEKKPIGWDIETIGDETACHGFANSPTEGMCINWRDKTENRYSEREEGILLKRIQRVLVHPTARLVAQNGMFDMSWCWYKDRLRTEKLWFDTMLAHHTIYPTLPHGLGFITTQYTDHPYYKDEGKLWKEGGDIDTFWEYNVKDCCIMLDAQARMLRELKDHGLDEFFFGHVMRLQPHLVKMAVHGVRIDTELKDKIASELKEEVANLKEQYFALAKECVPDLDHNPNPDSPTQTAKLWYVHMGLSGVSGTSTDKLARSKLRAHPSINDKGIELLDVYDKYKAEKKFLSTYANMKVDDDDRVRCEYKQTGVQKAPGRLSSASSAWGTGTNLQNQPQRAYPFFIADQGYELNYFDLSGAEARIVAHVAGIQKWIDDFARKDSDEEFDTHRATAADIFGIPYDEVPTKDREDDGTPTLRFIGKKCKHGLNYRMKPPRLAETTGLDIGTATRAYDAYHAAYPEIQRWWAKTIDTVQSTNMLWTPQGRRLLILGRTDSEEALESVVAFVPQSTIGDKVSQVIYQCESDPEWPSTARMLLNVHDALIALNKIGDGPVVRRIMKKYAESPIMINNTPVIIPIEAKVSVPDERNIHRWSSLKDV